MLVLSRKRNESIQIGGSTVMVLSIQGDRVRLGIDADPDVGIYRSELLDQTTEPKGDLVEA
jgi:carbon storage regulator